MWVNIGVGDGAMQFIINKKISFNVAERTISDEKKQHLLSNPSCRLLLVLLENHNRLMTRDDLLQKVWADFGLEPSNNSLNNNVSILRKIFAEFDIYDVLKTLPKQGFTLTFDDLQFNDKSRDNVVMQALSQPDKEPRLKRSWLIGFSATLAITFAVGVMYYENYFGKRDEVVFFKKINECNIYYFNGVSLKRVESYFAEGKGAALLDKCAKPYDIYYDDSKLLEKTDLLEIIVAKCTFDSKGGQGECKNFVTTKGA